MERTYHLGYTDGVPDDHHHLLGALGPLGDDHLDWVGDYRDGGVPW